MELVFKAVEIVGLPFIGSFVTAKFFSAETAEKVSNEYQKNKLINAAISLVSSNNVGAFCWSLTGFGALLSFRMFQRLQSLEHEYSELSSRNTEVDSNAQILALLQQNQLAITNVRRDLRITNNDNRSNGDDNNNSAVVASPSNSAQQQQQQQQQQQSLSVSTSGNNNNNPSPRALQLQTMKDRVDNARRDLFISAGFTFVVGSMSVVALFYLNMHASRRPEPQMVTEIIKTADGGTITKTFPAAFDHTKIPKHGDPSIADMKVKNDMGEEYQVKFFNPGDKQMWISRETFPLPVGSEIQNHDVYGKDGAKICLSKGDKNLGCKLAFYGSRFNASDFG